MAATKKLMVLSPRQIDTATIWFSFVGNTTDVDKVVLRRIKTNGTVVISDRECSVFMRWWNYLPSNLIETRDRDLYDTMKAFLYDN
jgi:hypothetical protein